MVNCKIYQGGILQVLEFRLHLFFCKEEEFTFCDF